MEGEIWKANRNRMGHTSAAMRALLDYVSREGPLFPRDIGARFGVSLPAARYRLKVALEAGLVVARNRAGDVLEPGERWRPELLLSGEYPLELAPPGQKFLASPAA